LDPYCDCGDGPLQKTIRSLTDSTIRRRRRLGNHGTGGSRLVSPVGRKLSGGSVVSCQSVDSGFDQNETELGVLVLSVLLQVLSDLNGLLDKHVEILGDFGGESVGLEDANDLLSGDGLDLGNSVGITENDTNLGGGQTLLGELADVLFDIGRGHLQPRGGSALVRLGTLGDTLSGSMHTTHLAANDWEKKTR